MHRRSKELGVSFLAIALIALGGCATSTVQCSGGTASVGSGPPAGGPIITIARRAQSAVEGLVVGAAIGMQAGPIGAAVGAGTFLIYGALTGHSPLDGRGGGGGGSGGYGAGTSEERREAALEEQIEQEVARGDALEDEIAAELERQERLLEQIDSEDAEAKAIDNAADPAEPSAVAAPAPSDADLTARANPRIAPTAPRERKLPLAIFDKEEVTIAAGAWGDNKKMHVLRRTLDADQDGKPEQIRYYDDSGQMIRKEQDQNYDGNIDTWSTYEQGVIVFRVMDSNDDHNHDVWETYANGMMTRREVDRDYDAVHDAFYTFQADSLVEERHDADNDGKMDLIVLYENRKRIRVEEDRNKNGSIDMWTRYHVVGEEELIATIQKDETGDGKVNITETFAVKNGQPVIARREEDKNGDGNIDVTSFYKNGKLQRREIADPNMVPL